jgi:acid phosphatase (class A)
MTLKSLAPGAAVLLAALGLGAAPPDAPASGMGGAAAKAGAGPSGVMSYLTPEATPDAKDILGPPPPDGSGTKAGDVATYQATRKLEGTPRWRLAARDAVYGPAPMMADFACAVGVVLTSDNAPALFHLLGRMQNDSARIMGHAKIAYGRPRPFVELGGTICVKPETWLAKSYSYPSGHSTFSWTAGLTLSEIVPDRAAAILARARAYGESRVVCGVHYESDVLAGRTTAAALFGALQNNPAFQADLEAARAELAKLRAGPVTAPNPAECKIEADASATPVW